MIYDRAKFECRKWRATATATTFLSMMVSLLILYLVPRWNTVDGGLQLLVLPFVRVVYVDTDASVNRNENKRRRGLMMRCMFYVHYHLHYDLFVKSQPICGPLGPNFDGFCANNTTKKKLSGVPKEK